MPGEFIAIDWGTTNRRIFVVDADGVILHREQDARGVLSLRPHEYAGEVRSLRARLGDWPILCAGMVGSINGWTELPYVPLPTDLSDLAANVRWVEAGRTAIIPGVSLETAGRADIMRGEEVQFLGAVAAGLAPSSSYLCQPGTHCKWGEVRDGRLAEFTTAMTGELFALLRGHSLLSSFLPGEPAAADAFLAGVTQARQSDLLASLFEIRAASLLGRRRVEDNSAYLSGLLIGSDVAARLTDGPCEVHVLADGNLGALYEAAITHCGGIPRSIDASASFVAGITQIREKMR